jgi:MFS family permease
MAASGCFAAGLLSYELISYHLTHSGRISPAWMPVVLACATGCGVLANLALGRLYDWYGVPVVLGAVALSALFVPLLFLGKLPALVVAMPLLGIGYAVQDTLFKAIVADVLPQHKRGLAFGLFYTGYGCGWLVGSTATGLLYEHSHAGLAAFAMAAQLGSLPFFLFAYHRQRNAG